MERPEQLSESPPPKPIGIPAGTLVGGRYRIGQLLGQGGFGRSYLVTDTQRFDEPCVLKEFVPPNQAAHLLQKAVDMFKREAKTLYQINHPQIPRFLASFTQARRLFIVQEYINGITYAQLLKERQQQGQVFSETEMIQWLRDLLPVLDYLHSLKLIHRDISPDNIMFSRDRGLPVLIDFGLVKNLIAWSATSEVGEYISQTSRLGKFGYSPPEQIHMGHCYPCSDLYALGVTAIVLMAGKHPSTLIDAKSMEWRWESSIRLKTPLNRILHRMLMPQPKNRFQTAHEVLDAMQRLPLPRSKAGSPTAAPSYPPPSVESAQPKQLAHSVELQGATEEPLTPAALVERCRQELTRCIGPIAPHLVDALLEQQPDITCGDFISALTAHISTPEGVTEFTQRLKIPTGFPAQQPLMNLSTPEFVSETTQCPPSLQSPGAELNPIFIDQCRQALTHHIGPIAPVLMQQVLTHTPQLTEKALVAVLAAKIASPQAAAEFQQQLMALWRE